MLQFEQRITCESETGKRYHVEIFVEVRRKQGREVPGPRQAFLAGTDTQVKLNSIDGDNVFQVPGGGLVLRRVKM